MYSPQCGQSKPGCSNSAYSRIPTLHVGQNATGRIPMLPSLPPSFSRSNGPPQILHSRRDSISSCDDLCGFECTVRVSVFCLVFVTECLPQHPGSYRFLGLHHGLGQSPGHSLSRIIQNARTFLFDCSKAEATANIVMRCIVKQCCFFRRRHRCHGRRADRADYEITSVHGMSQLS